MPVSDRPTGTSAAKTGTAPGAFTYANNLPASPARNNTAGSWAGSSGSGPEPSSTRSSPSTSASPSIAPTSRPTAATSSRSAPATTSSSATSDIFDASTFTSKPPSSAVSEEPLRNSWKAQTSNTSPAKATSLSMNGPAKKWPSSARNSTKSSHRNDWYPQKDSNLHNSSFGGR